MLTASKEDFNTIKEGKMSLSKLRLLPKVNDILKNQLTWETFIKNDGIKIFGFWITPHPSDKTFPCITIIKTILKLLSDI